MASAPRTSSETAEMCIRDRFAIALWDRASRKLVLARDRMGEKPLYYGYSGAELVFASELKGLMPIPGFGRNLNRNALASFMRHNYCLLYTSRCV